MIEKLYLTYQVLAAFFVGLGLVGALALTINPYGYNKISGWFLFIGGVGTSAVIVASVITYIVGIWIA